MCQHVCVCLYLFVSVCVCLCVCCLCVCTVTVQCTVTVRHGKPKIQIFSFMNGETEDGNIQFMVS